MTGFSKDRRLLKSSEFNRVFDGGVKHVAPRLVCLGVLSQSTEHTQGRLGLVVSKKVGNAVVRNRVKRRLREIYRLTPESITTGLDFVVVARPLSSRSEYLDLKKDFSFALERLSRKIRILLPSNPEEIPDQSFVDPSP